MKVRGADTGRHLCRILSLLLVISLLLTAAVGCGEEPPIPDRSFDEQTVIAAAKELLPKAATVNELFYGDGIPARADEGAHTSGRYREADPTFLSDYGIATLTDLRAMARAVYAESFCTSLFKTTLEAQYDADVIVGYRRYLEIASTETTPYILMVDTAANVLLPDEVTYDLASVKTDGAKGELVYIKVNVTVTRTEDGATQSRTVRIALIEEAEGWRFYELTGASYSSYYDRVGE